MQASLSSFRSKYAKITLVVFLVVSLAVFTWIIPPRAEVLHNILHHLNILPFVLAGLFFGWRGALQTMLLAIVLQAPSIYKHWFRAPLDAQDQVVELSTFGAAGIIAGVLADRERMQRARVEATKRELEQVHQELQQNIDQLRKSERLSAAGQLSASLAHEIRNPLASISGAAGIIARGQSSPESRAECLDILMKESQRLNKLLTNFLEFARPRLPRLQKTDPAELIWSVASLVQHSALRHNVEVRIEAPQQLNEVECDAEQIKQLLLNLVINAIEATPTGKFVQMRARTIGDRLHLEVADKGPGVRVEDRERIFDPFFTTKQSGTGLGLAISATIAAQHGGSISCSANGTEGALFLLELPSHRTSPLPKDKVMLA